MSPLRSIRLSLGVLAAGQLSASFLLQLLVLAVVRVGAQTDAYIAALTVPILVFAIVGTSIQNAWQPKLALAAADTTEWRVLQGAATGQVLLVAGGAALILGISAPWWVQVVFPGFDAPQCQSTAYMSQLLLIGSIFTCLTGVHSAAQRGREKFISAELVPLAGTLLSFPAVIILVPGMGIEAVVWISLLRSVAVWFTMSWLTGFAIPSIKAALAQREMWKMTTPLFAGASLYKTGPLIDRFWSSQAAAGSLTAFSLVQTGLSALGTVLDRAFCLTSLPRLAHFAKSGDLKAMQSLCRRAIIHTAYATAALAVVLLALRPFFAELAELATGMHGDVAGQLWLLTVMMLGYLWVTGCGYLLVAAFYALGDTRTPMTMSSVAFVLGAVMKTIGFLCWGIVGLAAATSAYYMINLFSMAVLLQRRVRANVP